MDVVDWLKTVTSRCRLVPDPQQAIRLVPDIGVETPAFWNVDSAEAPSCIAVACTSRIGHLLAKMLLSSVGAAMETGEGEDVSTRTQEDWAEDPFVRTMVDLLLEAARVSPAAMAIPFLECMRISSSLMNGSPPYGLEASSESRKLLDLVRELDGHQQKGSLLSASTLSVTARWSAAWSLTAGIDATIQPTRFYQALVKSRMNLVFPPTPGSLPPVSDVMGFLGLPGNPALVERVMELLVSVARGIHDRVSTGKASPADNALLAPLLALDDSIPSTDNLMLRLSRDPATVTSILCNLSDFSGPRELREAGFEKEEVSQLLERSTALPLAASMRTMLSALQLWDLISAVVSFLKPALKVHKASTPPGPDLTLAVPRGDFGGVPCAVLALRLVDHRTAALNLAQKKGLLFYTYGLEQSWHRLKILAARNGGLALDTGSHLILVFRRARAALETAISIQDLLSQSLRIHPGKLGDDLLLSDIDPPGLGLDMGSVLGGGDGERTAFFGETLERAVHLAGMGPPHDIPEDPLGIHRAFRHGGELFSRGIVCTPAFLRSYQEEIEDAALPYRVLGSPESIAGIDTDFRHYPVRFTQEKGDDDVILMVALDSSESAPLEVLCLPGADFHDFYDADREIARTMGARRSSRTVVPAQITSPVPPGEQPAQGIDPFESGLQQPADYEDPFAEPDGGTGSVEESTDDTDDSSAGFAVLLEDDFTGEEDRIVDVDPESSGREPYSLELEDDEDDDLVFEDGFMLLSEEPGQLVSEPLKAGDSPVQPPGTKQIVGSSPITDDGAGDGAFLGFLPPANEVHKAEPDVLAGHEEQESPAHDAHSFVPAPEPEATTSPDIGQQGELTGSTAQSSTSPGVDHEDSGEEFLGYLPPASADAVSETPALQDPAPEDLSSNTEQPHAQPDSSLPGGDDTLPGLTASSDQQRMVMDDTLNSETDGQHSWDEVPLVWDDSTEPVAGEQTEPTEPTGLSETGQEQSEEELESSSEQAGDDFLDLSFDEDAADDPFQDLSDFFGDAVDMGDSATEAEPGAPSEDKPFEERELFRDLDAEDTLPSETTGTEPEPSKVTPAGTEVSGEPPSDDDFFDSLFGDDEWMDATEPHSRTDPETEQKQPEREQDLQAPAPSSPEPFPLEEELEEDILQDDKPAQAGSPHQPEEEPDESGFEGLEQTRLASQDQPVAPEEASQEDHLLQPLSEESGESVPPVELEEPPREGSVPEAQPEQHPGAEPPESAHLFMAPDFRDLFRGYRLFEFEDGSVLLGHIYGTQLLDAHEYQAGDDPVTLYMSFLRDKINDGFIPRSDLQVPIPSEVPGQPLDDHLMKKAFLLLNDA